MKMKCYYWDDVSVRRCSIINEEKYNIGYSVYLARLIQETYFEWGEEMLSEIEKIEKERKKYTIILRSFLSISYIKIELNLRVLFRMIMKIGNVH